MKNNRRIVVNVTTLKNWYGNPVGVVRTETEFVKFILKDKEEDHIFCFYDQRRGNFFEISDLEVIDFLRRAEHEEKKENKTGSVIRFDLKSAVKRSVQRVIDDYCPGLVSEMIWVTSKKLREIYHDIYLVPLYYVKKRMAEYRLRLKSNEDILKGAKEIAFTSGDVFISMGLDWDNLNLVRLYELKKLYKFKVVMFCYDLIPVKLPHLCVFSMVNAFSRYFGDLAWCADKVLCISKNSLKDLKEFLADIGCPSPELKVIRLGDVIKKRLSENEQPSDKIKHLENEKFILFVSTIERRKNHETLYKACVRMIEKYGVDQVPKMVFVGMYGWGVTDLSQDISADPRLQGKIEVLHRLADDDLNYLYKHCLFTVFPSLYEGWGLPVAESLVFGKFCLCSNSSSIPEVGGNLVEYLDPWDMDGWAKRIYYYAHNPKALKQKEKSLMSYKPYLWGDFGKSVIGEVHST